MHLPQNSAVTKSSFTPSIRAADALRVGASGRASLHIRTANNVVTMAEAKKSVKDLPAGALKGKKVAFLHVLYACYMRFDSHNKNIIITSAGKSFCRGISF